MRESKQSRRISSLKVIKGAVGGVMESLEHRRLLAFQAGYNQGSGDLVITGTGANENVEIIITVNANQIDHDWIVKLNGTTFQTGTDQIFGVTASMGGGNDAVNPTGSGNLFSMPISVDGGAGTDAISFAGQTVGRNFSLADGGGLNMATSNVENVIGSSGNDVLYGNSGNNVIFGGPGNDLIDWNEPGLGSDTINGESGNDSIMVGSGVDEVIGGSGTDAFSITGGRAVFTTDNSGDSLTMSAGVATLTVTEHFGAIVMTGGRIDVEAGGDKVLRCSSLSMNTTGKINLFDNDLIVDYTGGTSPLGTWSAGNSHYTGITGYIQNGRGNGTWNGSDGIVTTMTDATSTGITGIAVAEASSAKWISGTQTVLFSGETVDATTVLVKYSYSGDADLNGKLDGEDYFYIDNNMARNTKLLSFNDGDFDYNGSCEGEDYFYIDSYIIAAQDGPTY